MSPLMTPRLGRLQFHLYEADDSRFGWRYRAGAALSGIRYWLWFLTGGSS